MHGVPHEILLLTVLLPALFKGWLQHWFAAIGWTLATLIYRWLTIHRPWLAHNRSVR